MDTALRVSMDVLITAETPEFTDGVQVDPAGLLTVFPYLNTPLSGSAN